MAPFLIFLLILLGVLFIGAALYFYYCLCHKAPEPVPYEEGTKLQSVVVTDEREIYEEKKRIQLIEIRRVQSQQKSSPKVFPDCSILIGVDATPAISGGYCVDFDNRTCEMYTLPNMELPFCNSDPKNPAEFEMKNLIFALLIWENKIKNASKFQVYTDNYAINKNSDPHGRKAKMLLQHFVSCEGIELTNARRVHVNRSRDADGFAKFIQPADDLSRWVINTAQAHITDLYGIENITKTHYHEFGRNVQNRPRYVPTELYNQFLEQARARLVNWKRTPCQKCGFTIDDNF